jgi:putative FmdB family regulatory protein
MPTYEYRCGSCGATYESRRSIADMDAPISCPHGHPDAVRRLSVFAVTTTAKPEERALPAISGCGAGCACASSAVKGQKG